MFTNIEDRFACRSTERIPAIRGLAWLEVALPVVLVHCASRHSDGGACSSC